MATCEDLSTESSKTENEILLFVFFNLSDTGCPCFLAISTHCSFLLIKVIESTHAEKQPNIGIEWVNVHGVNAYVCQRESNN